MEYEVDDFFNEINEIAPPKKIDSKQETVWKQCHDELTGYTYFWNTETDEVTWQAPQCFKLASKKDTSFPKDPPQLPPKTKPNLYVPPKTPAKQLGAVKIYSIGECSQQTFKISDNDSSRKKKKKIRTTKAKESVLKKFLGRDSESEDEKIELISSYGAESDLETEEPPSKKNKHDDHDSDHNEEEDDDLDILSQIKRAQALKDISDNKKPKTVAKEKTVDKPPKNVPGLKLVAGYSDSEEDEPNESTVVKAPAFVKPESHSTLFPITKPIDIKDFEPPKIETEDKVPNQADFIDTKAFQRKKRIGVALVNTGKKKEDVADGDGERKGLGFSTGEHQTLQPNSNVYPGFAKGGVMFVKTDVLQPSLPSETVVDKIEKKDEEEIVNKKEVEDMYQTLKEKLGFLNVGTEVFSPVQTMIIQSEILFLAMNEGGLKLSYLQKWLQNTCSELKKLEKEATPEGWLLQWDRLNKRYYYQNVSTGASQWEYPVELEAEPALPPQLPAPKPRSSPPPPPPLPSDDDAMDICTTPPPPGDLQEVAPPPPASPPPPPAPPVISCPSPPPPPIISRLEGGENGPLPPPPPPETPYPGEIVVNNKDIKDLIERQQPLPPGVDIPPPPPNEPPDSKVPQAVELPGDPLKSALNSFYSDIAALNSDLPAPQPSHEKPAEILDSEQIAESVKIVKKKKPKVKFAAGLTLKKKGVTQLVEKWNTLHQNNYD